MRFSPSAALPVVIAACMALPAAAQTLVEVQDRVLVPAFDLTADTVDDLDVTDANGAVIGEVEEVLGSSADLPTALAIDFDDSRADLGREDRVIGLDQFDLTRGVLVLRLPVAEVAKLPVWHD